MKNNDYKLNLGSGYFNFNIPDNLSEMPHCVFSEECWIPFTNSCDTQRINMWSNHITQMVHLTHPEMPKVFTGFENQIGEYSIGYKRASDDLEVVAKIVKNKYVYTLVVKHKNGVYDVINMNKATNISEDYGYGKNDFVSDKNPGDVINEGSLIYATDNYDEAGNFAYGTNLKAIYVPWKGQTYEDGFVITESGAKKLESYKVETTTVSLNGNDVLLNLYHQPGDYLYHSIPKVGEMTKSNILVASRRLETNNILFNFQTEKLKQLDANDYKYYTSGGEIVDIDIYSNISLEKMKSRNNEFSTEISYLYEDQLRYYQELVEVLDKIIPPLTEQEYVSKLSQSEKLQYNQEKKEYGNHYYVRPTPRNMNSNKYTDELDYLWKVAHEYLDPYISWRSDGKRFENFKIKFTILKRNPLTIGSKVTGR